MDFLQNNLKKGNFLILDIFLKNHAIVEGVFKKTHWGFVMFLYNFLHFSQKTQKTQKTRKTQKSSKSPKLSKLL